MSLVDKNLDDFVEYPFDGTLTFFTYACYELQLQCARQGFALGLTALISTQPNIKVDSLLKLIVNILEVSSSMKGQVIEIHVH